MGNVGNGTEFGADLFKLYRAGKIHLPAAAGHYQAASWKLKAAQGAWGVIAGQLMNPAGTAGIEDARAMLQNALGRTATRLDDAGDALVEIAKDYQRTDDAAHEEFQRRKGELTGADAQAWNAPDTDPVVPQEG